MKLSLKSYAWKCVLGLEAVYVVCYVGGYLPIRMSAEATELHHRLFETMRGFVWANPWSFVLGAVYMLAFAWIFGAYYVWMHNSSIEKA